MDAAKLQQICKEAWKPFQKKFPHLAEDAQSAAVLAAFEEFLGKGTTNPGTLERIARNAVLDYLEQNAE